jgi:hypothetical protein
MSSLSPEMITSLLQKGRTRGDYESVIRKFLESGEAGIEVDLSSGALAGKTADQAKIGLDNSRKRVDSATGKPVIEGGHALKVVKVGKEGEEQHVYLIDTNKVQGAAAQSDSGDEDEE